MLGDGLGTYFAKGEYEQSHYRGGYSGVEGLGCAALKQILEVDGRKRSCEDVYDIVTNKNGGDKGVVVLGELKRTSGSLIALFSKILDSDSVEGVECGLRGGEVR